MHEISCKTMVSLHRNVGMKGQKVPVFKKAPENSRNERKGREGRGQRQQRNQRGTQHGTLWKTLGSAHYYCCYCWQCATRKSYHATSFLVKLGKHAPGFTPRILVLRAHRNFFLGAWWRNLIAFEIALASIGTNSWIERSRLPLYEHLLSISPLLPGMLSALVLGILWFSVRWFNLIQEGNKTRKSALGDMRSQRS